jgi:uncharacterized protein YjiS (DUF1127 family)
MEVSVAHLVSSTPPRSLPVAASSLTQPAQMVRTFPKLILSWRRRAEYRRELRRLLILGPHLVDDVGLLPVLAGREAAKPFWRA